MNQRDLTPSRDREEEVAITLAQLESAMHRRRRILVLLPFAVGILTAAAVLVFPRTYTTTVSFIPQGKNVPSGIAGIAQQFGVSVGADDPTQTPGFYADLLSTPELIRQLSLSRYSGSTEGAPASGTFITLYEIDEGDEGKTLSSAIREIRENVMRVQSDPTTSIVRVTLSTKWSWLSEQMASRLLALVDSFNVQVHQRNAEAERRFIESRVQAARGELSAAENILEAFLRRNREFRNDPQLAMEHDRLEREVSMRQQVYTGLTQVYEQARMEAVRNTPAIGIIEPPRLPLQPDRRHLLFKVVLAMMFAFGATAAIVVLQEIVRGSRAASEGDVQRLARLRSETAHDLRSLGGLLPRRTREHTGVGDVP